jgi:methylamine utilization protein MauE
MSVWVVPALNVGAATLLISAGVLKLATPDVLMLALDELSGERRLLLPRSLVRVASVFEIAIACLLLETQTRITAAYVVAVLGICFAALGIAGAAHHSTLPCGCLGRRGTTPLGIENVVLGTALVAVLPVNALVSDSLNDSVFSTVSISVVALATVLLGVWPHRASSATLARAIPLWSARSGG